MSGKRWLLAVTWLAIAAVLLATAGCGKDDGGASKEQITGTWHATRLEYASTTGPDVVELISAGCTATLVLNEDNTLVYTIHPAQGADKVLTATWELMGDIGDLMRVTVAGGHYWGWDVEYTGGTLKLSGADEFDFNHDAMMEPAHWSITLVR